MNGLYLDEPPVGWKSKARTRSTLERESCFKKDLTVGSRLLQGHGTAANWRNLTGAQPQVSMLAFQPCQPRHNFEDHSLLRGTAALHRSDVEPIEPQENSATYCNFVVCCRQPGIKRQVAGGEGLFHRSHASRVKRRGNPNDVSRSR